MYVCVFEGEKSLLLNREEVERPAGNKIERELMPAVSGLEGTVWSMLGGSGWHGVLQSKGHLCCQQSAPGQGFCVWVRRKLVQTGWPHHAETSNFARTTVQYVLPKSRITKDLLALFSNCGWLMAKMLHVRRMFNFNNCLWHVLLRDKLGKFPSTLPDKWCHCKRSFQMCGVGDNWCRKWFVVYVRLLSMRNKPGFQ